jgi:hypothetical protein
MHRAMLLLLLLLLLLTVPITEIYTSVALIHLRLGAIRWIVGSCDYRFRLRRRISTYSNNIANRSSVQTLAHTLIGDRWSTV